MKRAFQSISRSLNSLSVSDERSQDPQLGIIHEAADLPELYSENPSLMSGSSSPSPSPTTPSATSSPNSPTNTPKNFYRTKNPSQLSIVTTAVEANSVTKPFAMFSKSMRSPSFSSFTLRKTVKRPSFLNLLTEQTEASKETSTPTHSAPSSPKLDFLLDSDPFSAHFESPRSKYARQTGNNTQVPSRSFKSPTQLLPAWDYSSQADTAVPPRPRSRTRIPLSTVYSQTTQEPASPQSPHGVNIQSTWSTPLQTPIIHIHPSPDDDLANTITSRSLRQSSTNLIAKEESVWFKSDSFKSLSPVEKPIIGKRSPLRPSIQIKPSLSLKIPRPDAFLSAGRHDQGEKSPVRRSPKHARSLPPVPAIPAVRTPPIMPLPPKEYLMCSISPNPHQSIPLSSVANILSTGVFQAPAKERIDGVDLDLNSNGESSLRDLATRPNSFMSMTSLPSLEIAKFLAMHWPQPPVGVSRERSYTVNLLTRQVCFKEFPGFSYQENMNLESKRRERTRSAGCNVTAIQSIEDPISDLQRSWAALNQRVAKFLS